MAPKRSNVAAIRGPGRTIQKPGFLQSAYKELTASENQTVIRSVVIFGAAVAFFASSWSEFLVPPA